MKLLEKKKTNRTKLFVLVSVAAVVAVAATVYYSVFMNKPEGSQTTNTTPTNKTKGDTKEQNPTSTNKPAREQEKQNNKQYEGSPVDNNNTLTGLINYKGLSGGELVIRTTIDQAISLGTCQLKLTNGQKVVTKTAPIAQNPSSSTCQGFNVPLAELGSGNWNIDITVVSGERSATLTSTITI